MGGSGRVGAKRYRVGMDGTGRAERPKASSRETLAEAACELFLEQGYEATTIVDITTRAGVSRSSFFNYFSTKADVLWAGLDERIAALESRLANDEGTDAAAAVRAAIMSLGDDFAPDSFALAVVSSTAMGITDELEHEASLRRSRLARAVSERLIRAGADRLHADIAGAAWGGAVIAALEAWARDGAGRTSLRRFLARGADAASVVPAVPAAGSVRQLRVVVQAPDFDAALAFYRDAAGMPEAEAYEAEGGARVVILDAGRATLELANAAQVAFIDAVETDGGTSDPIRLALEVDDTRDAVERLTAGGAEVEATARLTPWHSLNARLRGPAGLQLTVFQELGPE
jgi:AcrR family transcriptional regulator/catechol 2,3-dioxygenase-like lactoylglutathione lyase family enzyme